MKVLNWLQGIPKSLPEEKIEQVLAGREFRMEKITSTGHKTRDGFWYDQNENEWLIIIQGEATIQIEGEPSPRRLGVGDSIELPAHIKHRVEWTTPKEPTVWLAVFYS